MPLPTDFPQNALPYHDTKPQGAPDFYFETNARFRFLIRKLGREGWIRYLRDLGKSYYAPVNKQWRGGGLAAVAQYWREFFAAEPGAKIEVDEKEDRVELVVHACPLIKQLRLGKREIVKEFCQHCYYLGQARASEAGMEMRLCGGNGSCRHTYVKRGVGLPSQEMSEIKEARL